MSAQSTPKSVRVYAKGGAKAASEPGELVVLERRLVKNARMASVSMRPAIQEIERGTTSVNANVHFRNQRAGRSVRRPCKAGARNHAFLCRIPPFHFGTDVTSRSLLCMLRKMIPYRCLASRWPQRCMGRRISCASVRGTECPLTYSHHGGSHAFSTRAAERGARFDEMLAFTTRQHWGAAHITGTSSTILKASKANSRFRCTCNDKHTKDQRGRLRGP
jgi:hypothetical protein